MNIIANILITAAVAVASAWGLYTKVPLNWLENEEILLGTSITTIAGTDTLSSSRGVINNNFTALNNGKIETSTTTMSLLTSAPNLATIGTIISGIWNGTAIGVGYGGTGTTSPTANMVMLGNGSSGFKTVAGFGSSGQSLVSTGDASAPAWQSVGVNQADDYTWTGSHTFTGDTGGLSPVGSITAYASTTAPTGWLLADGTAVSRSTYSNLYDVLGTSYGVGDGSTTFNLPDLSGRTIIMATSTQTYADVLGETGGATSTVLTLANIPAHNHDAAKFAGSSVASSFTGGTSATVGLVNNSVEADTEGSNTAHSNLDPYIVLNYIIKY